MSDIAFFIINSIKNLNGYSILDPSLKPSHLFHSSITLVIPSHPHHVSKPQMTKVIAV